MRKTYKVAITGLTPILMHQDSVLWADTMSKWQKIPENKKVSVAGDDRTPAWRWLGYLYHDGKNIVIPTANLMASIRGAAANVPTGKGQKTFKSQSQSGVQCETPFWTLLADGRAIPMESVEALKASEDFDEHLEYVKNLGFDLDVRRARVGQAKHIRVRPLFGAGWSASGVIAVNDDQITKEVLTQFLDIAGKYYGLMDWRPGCRTPGNYGMFTAVVG